MKTTTLIALLIGLTLTGCDRNKDAVVAIDEQRIINADSAPHDWLSHGRDYREQRFSPLDKITRDNVATLGLAWEVDMQSSRGLEATPLVIDGNMYVTSTWSRVIALDAATGDVLWRYDPEVPRSWAKKLCCDVVNRGVAAWGDRLFFATLDGRLIALQRDTGERVWEVDTLPDRQQWYSITGAPRVVRDKVIIGNGGAEYGVRGYVSAYSVADGALQWRFYTVPGDPSEPFEHPELASAAKTWLDVDDWTGLGGTAWDSMAYDPRLDLLYVGTGNGAPWSRTLRSPGGGDNLFLASILALDPDDGRLIWHYQTTPGDSWDYTATQHMILADLDIEGDRREVLMQAPKNGFFYVLDRKTGELISAEKFVFANWASHIDESTGRPVETGLGDYGDGNEAYVFPSPAGGHNWHPMSYSPVTGLVYIPARDIGWVFTPQDDKWFTYGVDNLPELVAGQDVPDTTGYLKAWDPVQQRLVWQTKSELIWNGGALSTAGGLVFYGTAAGELLVLDDASGTTLKRINIGTGIIAPPMTYAVGGTQYVAVLAGWGGPAFNTMQGSEAAIKYSNRGRLLVFALHGDPVPLPELRAPRAAFQAPPDLDADAGTIEKGRMLYVFNCGACHGMYGSTPLLPDLRRLSPEQHEIFAEIVLGGIYEQRGMPGFSDALTSNDVHAIQAYVVKLAREAMAQP